MAADPRVEVLSAGDGGPLTRTVKKIIDPLVIPLHGEVPAGRTGVVVSLT